MEDVNKEISSQKNNQKDASDMLPPPTPTGSAPRASSPKKAAPEIQVKASQPSREATPPISDALSPPSAQVPDEQQPEDNDTDQDATQEVDDDETMHDLQAYDWAKLEEEYEAAMAKCDAKEREATEEFQKLANVGLGFNKVKIVISDMYTVLLPLVECLTRRGQREKRQTL